jgi:hypothetical protein
MQKPEITPELKAYSELRDEYNLAIESVRSGHGVSNTMVSTYDPLSESLGNIGNALDYAARREADIVKLRELAAELSQALIAGLDKQYVAYMQELSKYREFQTKSEVAA